MIEPSYDDMPDGGAASRSSDPGSGSADRACRALIKGDSPDPADYRALRVDLIRVVNAKYHIPRSDVEEIVDAATVDFLSARQRVRAGTALSYLRQIVRNRAVDWLRKVKEQPFDEAVFVPEDDDSIARLIDARADAETVEAILRKAAKAGDTTRTRVLNAFLTLASVSGRTPSNRKVALESGLTHPTVARILTELREELGR